MVENTPKPEGRVQRSALGMFVAQNNLQLHQGSITLLGGVPQWFSVMVKWSLLIRPQTGVKINWGGLDVFAVKKTMATSTAPIDGLNGNTRPYYAADIQHNPDFQRGNL